MALNHSATVSADIAFSVTDNVGIQSLNESAAANYSVALSEGSGPSGIDSASLISGTLASGGEVLYDFQAFPKNIFGGSFDLAFTGIKAIFVQNRSSYLGADIAVKATGTAGFSGAFNGSGNYLVHPRGAFLYSNILAGDAVSASAKDFTIEDAGGSGANYTIIVVGVTGA